MPTKNEIQNEITTAKNSAQDTVRRNYLSKLHDFTARDTIVYATAFSSPKNLPGMPPQILMVSLDDIQGFMSALHGLKGDSLDLILHSSGGSLEAADQIVQYLRSKYKHIRAIIPQNAMSAATMIACACDVIVMGKHSAIGPIDPQITLPTAHGQFTAPAQAILDEFEQAKQEVKQDPKIAPLWVQKIGNHPAGVLNICQTTIDLAKTKVEDWLKTYMFKGKNDQKAHEIAEWLGDAKEHKTHGRPITIDIAESKGLRIEKLEKDQDFQEKILSVFHATTVTLEITSCVKLIENHHGKGHFLLTSVAKQP